MLIGIKDSYKHHVEYSGILEGGRQLHRDRNAYELASTQAAKAVADCAMQCQDDMDAVIDHIQKFSDQFGRKLQFRINSDTNRVVIKVIDTATDKVIREIPSEVIQKLRQELESRSGIFYDAIV